MIRKCSKCETDKPTGEKKSYFLVNGTSYICRTCLGLQESNHGAKKPHKPIFPRWRCNVHKCGSYNFNMLIRHETPWCEISTEHTVGVVKPKTFGGYNGDLSRKFLKDWNDFYLQAARRVALVKHWNRYSRSKRKGKKKYAYRPKRVSSYRGKAT